MVENNNSARITPEKQLLKLIEDPDNGEITKARTQYKAKSFFSTGFLRSSLALFKRTGMGIFGAGNELSLDFRAINWILKLSILGVGAYLAIDISSSMRNSREMPNIFVKKDLGTKKEVKIEEIQSALKPYSFYADKTEERDIFRPYEEKKVEVVVEEVKAVPGVSPTAANFVSDLEVVGIAWSDEPDVILHNRKINRTYFLKTGSSFGEAKVVEILESSVIIEYKGEEIEIK
ncbi:MAG: hypothetical protein ABH862_07025 [Candidatus Omnitrophota bacterium]